MTHYMRDYTDNVLAITDEQVAGDWRLGLLRAAGKVMTAARPTDSTHGRFGMTVPGSARAHMEWQFGTKGCTLTEIYNIQEHKGERYNFSTFGGSTDDVITMTALGTCACGTVERADVTLDMDPGELIYSVMNAE